MMTRMASSLRASLVIAVVATVWGAGRNADADGNHAWNPKSAATYLDSRAAWWMRWPGAARDHETFCISCHTALAYGLARPSLRSALGETGPSPNEIRLVENVSKRVRLWNDVQPYYGGSNANQSRGTEAVLNALILGNYGANTGKPSAETKHAFDNLWALQQTAGESRGAWQWIQFNNEPWEAHDSQYYGAALAAFAVGEVEGYRSAPEIQNRLQLLSDYLNREFAKQSPLNQAVVLWASVHWPGLLPADRRDALVHDLMNRQQPDGGWSIASLVWTWRDWSFTSLAKLWVHSEATPLHPKSDGYATGLIALALEQSGIRRQDPHIQNARAWLVRNQNHAEGRWPAYSPNGKRDHAEGQGLFLNDAATAYAVLALTAE